MLRPPTARGGKAGVDPVDDENNKLERIRKLLAKAEKAGTPDEAEIYNGKAAELMARHSIDSAMLAAGDPGRDTIGFRTLAMTDPYSKEKATLAGGIATTMSCRVVSHPGSRRGQINSVTLIGFESDLNRVELSYTSLLLQATRSVVRERPPVWSGESTAAFRRTWLIGFAAEVHRRFFEAAERAASDHDSTRDEGRPSAEIALADRKSLVDRAVGERFTRLNRPPPRRLVGSGYRAGIDAGRRADLGQTRIRSHGRELGPGRS